MKKSIRDQIFNTLRGKSRILFWLMALTLTLDMAVVDNLIVHFLIIFLLLFSLIMICRVVYFDLGDLFIFSSMFTFLWFYEHSLIEAFKLSIGVTCVYQVGKLIAWPPLDSVDRMNRTHGDICDKSFVMIVILSVGLFVEGLINYSWHLFNEYYYEWPTWRGILRPKTQHEFYLILSGCLIFTFIVLFRKKKILSLVGIFISLVSVIISIIYRGRMVIGCVVGAALVAFLVYGIENKTYKKRVFWIAICSIVVLSGVIVSLISLNVAGLYEWYIDSIWGKEGGLFQNVRYQMMWKSITLLKEYPYGNCDVSLLKGNGYFYDFAHNSWLDVGRRGGIIPLLLMLSFTIVNVVYLVKVLRRYDCEKKYIFLSAYVGMTLYNMFEPAILANYVFWNVEVFLGGLITGLYFGEYGKNCFFIRLRRIDC